MADNQKQYDLEQVVTIKILEEYLSNNFYKFITPDLHSTFKTFSEQEKLNLLERIVRVEDAIKAQNDKIELLLHQMDKRFEQVDKRFEQVDKRFSVTQWIIGLGFTLIVVLMSIFEFIK